MTLPFDLAPGAAAYMAVVLFVAAFVRGYSGFGFAALVVSGAALVTNPLLFVPVVLIVDIFLTLAQIPGLRGNIDWRRVGFLSLGMLAGVPVGVWAVNRMGVDLARGIISGFILLMCAILWSGWSLRRPAGGAGHAGMGVVSGMANGAAVGGLPIAAFFAAQGVPPAVFRATLIVYFTCLDLWTIPNMARAGMIGQDTLVASAMGMPVLLLGIWLGGRHFLRANPQEFRRFAILLLAGLALLGLGKSVI